MNLVMKIFLSMSFSGALLILVLSGAERLLKDTISRKWQYYIWLIVILRLLLPFGPEISLMGKAYQTVDQITARTASFSELSDPYSAQENVPVPAADQILHTVNADPQTNALTTTARPFQSMGMVLIRHLWLIWLVTALCMLVRKVTAYQSFIRYIHAGAVPVSDLGMLDRLSEVAAQAGIKKPVELCVNPLISSPLLTGFFQPCIVLPDADISEKDFSYIILHELIHYRRKDLLYKWLVQVTICLHWFNPFVHLMGRKITNACEFSCDEAVLAKTGCEGAKDYGKTLLNAMAAVGKHRENPGTITLSENKRLLKERLDAIMKIRKPSRTVKMLTAALTLCMVFGAAFVGVYTEGSAAGGVPGTHTDAADRPPVSLDSTTDSSVSRTNLPSIIPDEQPEKADGSSPDAKQCYETGSLPLFEIAFSQLDENAQKTWLEKLYADDSTAFFSAAVRGLDADSPLPADFAKRAYADGEIAFFSILADCMDETELESWLNRTLEDKKWDFQSLLFDRLDREEEFNKSKEKWEKEADEAQQAEYQAAGVTMDGKDYYYQGQLAHIFLDIRANQSFYTLNMNPTGTINIKIIRDEKNQITGVGYMTEEEVAELLSDRL